MLIEIDFTSDIPVYMQIRHQIVVGIGDGRLGVGDSLPTTRQLAKHAGINPMTVSKAYQLLKAEGFIVIDRRHGARVAPRAQEGDCQEIRESLKLLVAEAKIKGIKKEDMVDMIFNMYKED